MFATSQLRRLNSETIAFRTPVMNHQEATTRAGTAHSRRINASPLTDSPQRMGLPPQHFPHQISMSMDSHYIKISIPILKTTFTFCNQFPCWAHFTPLQSH